MSEMMLVPTWRFTVADHEMKLILMALGGRLSDKLRKGEEETEVDQAKRLGDRLTVVRIQEMEERANHLRKALGLPLNETPV